MREQVRARIAGEFALKTSVKSLLSIFVSPIIALVVIAFSSSVADVDARLAASVLVFFSIVLGCFGGMNTEMVSDQLDGTILRCRTLGSGVGPYLVAKGIVMAGYNLVAVVAVYLVCALAFPGSILPRSAVEAVALVCALVTALSVSTVLGALIGAVTKSNAGMLGSTVVSYVVILTSGVLFPVESFPAPVRWIVEVLPVYWVGSLFRMAGGTIAADGAAILTAVAVSSLWIVIGVLALPRTVAAMTNRQTPGSLRAKVLR